MRMAIDLRMKRATTLHRCIRSLALSALLLSAQAGESGRLFLHGPTDSPADSPTTIRLNSADARQQLLLTEPCENGLFRDWTRRASYEAAPEGVVQIGNDGLIIPLANGTASVTARLKDGRSASLTVQVENIEAVLPVNFPNQIVPIFTKAGCNAGGCHGKAGGQNGFKLSLLGFEPTEDFEHLVKEARGRRIFPAAPEHSLLLVKATGTLPHGGGKRMEPNSDDFRLIVRWINQGMPYGKSNDPTVDRIEVFPKQRTLSLGADQQLIVVAHYTDGSKQDVTRSALYEPNDKEMAKADSDGYVKMFEQPGDVAIMVRYQAKVAVFQATVPLGAPVDNLPPARSFIDELVFKKLKTIGMPPSEQCDDATFLRRVSIDIAGRLPTLEETTRFLADPDPSKRDRWIDSLLDSPGYAEYFANKWSALLRNKRTAPTHIYGTYAFHAWIRDSLLVNKPYDQFAREIVAASGEIAEHPPVAWYRQVREPNAQLEDIAQLFLGTRLQCAQCHHHPFERWSQQDYYSFAAFFSQVGRKQGPRPGEEIIFHKRGKPAATNKKTQKKAAPAGLGSPALELDPDVDPRLALADWMSGKNNPFFAHALVNRYWKHFFGRALVEPEDDMRDTNPATNPELLQALAGHFIESGFDLKNLVRTICQSRVYQLSSIPNPHNAVDKQHFSRYYPKRLTAEALLDAVNQVTQAESQFDGLPPGTRAVALPDNSFNANSYFLTVFGRPDMASSCECERSQDASLAQSLHLLNAKDIQEKLSNDKGRAAVLAADNRPEPDKLRELYLWAYSREPNAKELEVAAKFIAKKIATKDEKQDGTAAKRQAYEDILWALINTKEFLFNH